MSIMSLDQMFQSAASVAAGPCRPEVAAALAAISPDRLAELVRALAYPRHASAQPDANRRAAEEIASRLRGFGYHTEFQGEHRNVVATRGDTARPLTLVGAHYDSVPETPGADDNASAVAGLLACAEAVSRFAPETPVIFVAFNREEAGLHGEDGLVGSGDFVRNYLPGRGVHIHSVHVLEMIGYCDPTAGAQRTPPGLPLSLPENGDWLGLVANAASAALMQDALRAARTYVPELPTLGLTLPPGAEALFPVLKRSDHAPFWDAGIAALQWTDTAEFRNPHYHQSSDTPETLDYAFLAAVTCAALACVLSAGS